MEDGGKAKRERRMGKVEGERTGGDVPRSSVMEARLRGAYGVASQGNRKMAGFLVRKRFSGESNFFM